MALATDARAVPSTRPIDPGSSGVHPPSSFLARRAERRPPSATAVAEWCDDLARQAPVGLHTARRPDDHVAERPGNSTRHRRASAPPRPRSVDGRCVPAGRQCRRAPSSRDHRHRHGRTPRRFTCTGDRPHGRHAASTRGRRRRAHRARRPGPIVGARPDGRPARHAPPPPRHRRRRTSDGNVDTRRHLHRCRPVAERDRLDLDAPNHRHRVDDGHWRRRGRPPRCARSAARSDRS